MNRDELSREKTYHELPSGRQEVSLLDVRNLQVSFYSGKGPVEIIRSFDLRLERGEVVGVLGESGSGKTVSASMLLRLFGPEEARIDGGSILFNGRDLTTAREKELRSIRGRDISFVFQDPSLALHPGKRVGRQLQEALKAHNLPYSREIITNALAEAGIGDPDTVYARTSGS